jgi:hypothetical protein
MFKWFWIAVLFSQLVFATDEVPKKTLYIASAIELEKGTTWDDVGVKFSENFIDTVRKSWKNWAETNFKNYEAVSLSAIPKDLKLVHNDSHLLKWSSNLKKTSEDTFELSAQYILLLPKKNEILISLVFPILKITVNQKNKQETSSKLASAIFNLLNSQTKKIMELKDGINKTSEHTGLVIKIKGNLSLSEMLLINPLLQEKLKDLGLSVEMRTFSTKEAEFFFQANTSMDKLLNALFEAGTLSLNEQKILIFNKDDKSFAIIPKEQNN